MDQHRIEIHGIPAIIWGKPSDKVFIHIHGKMSQKEYAKSFAEIADEESFQTLSFDLPEHGERKGQPGRCDVWNGTRDLSIIGEYASVNWKSISLFGSSLGAWFALQAAANWKLEKILFLSPICDMKWLVEHMMLWSDISEEQLEREKEIETPVDLLRWDYYKYILNHPVTNWHQGTCILYGGLDELQPIECLREFTEKFSAKLTVSPESKHAFMETRDGLIVTEWIRQSLTL